MYIKKQQILEFIELFFRNKEYFDEITVPYSKGKDHIEYHNKFKKYLGVFLEETKNTIYSKNIKLLAEDILYGSNNSNRTKELQNEVLFYEKKLISYFRDLGRSNIHSVLEVLGTSEESYFVGGCVRDILLGIRPKDFDFVTNIPYDKLKKMLEARGFKIKEEGKEFLVLIASKDGEEFEIANFRKDGTYEDGRRPTEVSIGTITDDAMRRDFGINSLYYNINTNELKDPSSIGLEGIINKELKFVGSPVNRLKEDSLRAWRFIRFLNTLPESTPNKRSQKAVKEHWKYLYESSNPQRVLQELQKMVKGF